MALTLPKPLSFINLYVFFLIILTQEVGLDSKTFRNGGSAVQAVVSCQWIPELSSCVGLQDCKHSVNLCRLVYFFDFFPELMELT